MPGCVLPVRTGVGAFLLLGACVTAPAAPPVEPVAVVEPVDEAPPDPVSLIEPVTVDPAPIESVYDGPPVPSVKPSVSYAIPVSDLFTPDVVLKICPKFNVVNAPPSGDDRSLEDYSPFVRVDHSVTLVVSPTNDACLSSGFGLRRGRPHKGLDLQSRPARMVHAGGDGTVLEAGFHRSFGHMVVIDHGKDVHTRYAHLAAIDPGIRAGEAVEFGAPLGRQGRTGQATAVHVHYEILLGNYNTRKRSFGLTAVDPFAYPFVGGHVPPPIEAKTDSGLGD